MADYPSDNYALHARLIGSVPRREEDLFLSIFCGLIFLGLAGYGIYQWRMPRTKEKDVFFPFKTTVLMGTSVACVFLGLAFFTRAVIAGNANPETFSKAAYAVENIFFIIAALIFVDLPALTIVRDETLWEELAATGVIPVTPRPSKFTAPQHWIRKYTIAFRALLILALFLNFAGFGSLPDPADGAPSKRSTNLRLFAALIVFLICCFMFMILSYVAIVYRLPKALGLIKSRIFVGVVVAMVTVTQLYNFLIVAVTDDSLSLIESKVFFYFAYALFPGLIAVTCAALEINLWTSSREFPWFLF